MTHGDKDWFQQLNQLWFVLSVVFGMVSGVSIPYLISTDPNWWLAAPIPILFIFTGWLAWASEFSPTIYEAIKKRFYIVPRK